MISWSPPLGRVAKPSFEMLCKFPAVLGRIMVPCPPPRLGPPMSVIPYALSAGKVGRYSSVCFSRLIANATCQYIKISSVPAHWLIIPCCTLFVVRPASRRAPRALLRPREGGFCRTFGRALFVRRRRRRECRVTTREAKLQYHITGVPVIPACCRYIAGIDQFNALVEHMARQ